MRRIFYLFMIIFIIVVIGYLCLHLFKPVHQSLQTKSIQPTERPIVLIVIDSLMDQPLQTAIQEGNAPNLQFLIENGRYYKQIVSSYPTMSISIDSTLLTGEYSDQHHIPGLVWFDVKNKQMINYGSAIGETWKTGLKNVLENTLYHVNHTHLNSQLPTIHESLAKQGLQSASINSLIYRGPKRTKIRQPMLLDTLQIKPTEGYVQTPELFSYGIFAQFHPHNNKHTFPWQRFGFNDAFTTLELAEIIEHGKLPAFTFAYLAELDQKIHKKGRKQIGREIKQVDQQLGKIFQAFGSQKTAIEEVRWIVMGDSGQSQVINDEKEALIHLNERFNDFQLYDVQKGARPDDQIAIAYNERMAYIYLLDEERKTEEIAQVLVKEERLAFIAWKDKEGFAHVISPQEQGHLLFRPEGDISDVYGQTWEISGNPALLDLHLTDGQLTYQNYPDGLARLYSALHSHPGNYFIVDAKLGYELAGDGTPTHVGGASHGSLHQAEAHVPMIVTGTDLRPRHERIVDLYDWIVNLLTKQDHDNKSPTSKQ